MKKIFTIIIFILICLSVKSQNIYPSYYVKNGDTLGIIISIKQAQKIDNDYDLLSLLKQSKTKQNELDSSYILVIDNYNKEVAELKLKISDIDSVNIDKNEQISNLKLQIDEYQKNQQLANQQLILKDDIIKEYKIQTLKLRIQKYIGFSVGGISIVTTVLVFLLKK